LKLGFVKVFVELWWCC